MNLERLIIQADPARTLNIPTGDSAQARWVLGQVAVRHPRPHVRSRPRRSVRSRVALTVAAAVCMTTGATAWALSSTPAAPGGSATAVLENAAMVAVRHPASVAAPGHSHPILTTTTYEVAIYAHGPSASRLVRVATAQYRQLSRVWVNKDGTEHALLVRSPLSFSSATDQAAWNASAAGQAFARQFQRRVIEPNLHETIAKVAGLPLQMGQLETIIATGRRGTNPERIPAGPTAVFDRTARLLVGPTIGLTPRLTAALYRLLAHEDQPRLTESTRSVQGHSLVTVASRGASGHSELTIDVTTGSGVIAVYPRLPASLSEPAPSGHITFTCATGGHCQSGGIGNHPESVTVLAPLRTAAIDSSPPTSSTSSPG